MFPFIKLTIALVATGGAAVAVYNAKQAPRWVIAVSFLAAIGAIIYALPEIPKFVDWVRDVGAQPPPVRSVTQAPRGRLDQCGILPDDTSVCCHDEKQRVFVEWEGRYSPYKHTQVTWRRYCRLPDSALK